MQTAEELARLAEDAERKADNATVPLRSAYGNRSPTSGTKPKTQSEPLNEGSLLSGRAQVTAKLRASVTRGLLGITR
jgi:hypothetical protein